MNLTKPEELMKLWDDYKKHIDTHPDTENIVTVKGDIVKKETKKPYLKQGFEAYVFRKKGFGIHDYLSLKYDEFSHVVTCIRREWEEDQISGTITGKYKAPNLVARLNGLTEKTDTTTNGQPINKITIEVVKSDVQIANNEKDINLE